MLEENRQDLLMEQLLDIASRYYAGDAAHNIFHVKRVAKLARQIAEDEIEAGVSVDLDVVFAAALFHDIVQFPKNHPRRSESSRLAADKAVELLSEQRFSKEQLENIHHAILTHSFSANIPCETIEAKIVQDADRMESLGAIGIARTFYTGGTFNSKLWDDEDPLAERREVNDQIFCVDHFFQKILRLPGTMQTRSGKKLAAQKAAYIKDYLMTLKSELDQAA